jgi:hypothetical protein
MTTLVLAVGFLVMVIVVGTLLLMSARIVWEIIRDTISVFWHEWRRR